MFVVWVIEGKGLELKLIERKIVVHHMMCTFQLMSLDSPFHSSLTIHSSDSCWSSRVACNGDSNSGDPVLPRFLISVFIKSKKGRK